MRVGDPEIHLQLVDITPMADGMLDELRTAGYEEPRARATMIRGIHSTFWLKRLLKNEGLKPILELQKQLPILPSNFVPTNGFPVVARRKPSIANRSIVNVKQCRQRQSKSSHQSQTHRKLYYANFIHSMNSFAKCGLFAGTAVCLD